MEALRTKINSNKAPSHFLAYSLSFMAYGLVITGLGPLVPYFAAQSGHSQTQYSFIFFARSIGFIFGAVMLRFLQKFMNFHQILLMASIVLLFLLGSFTIILDMTYQAVIMFFISAFCCFLEVTVNVCVLETQKDGDLEFWMLVCHGVFGIGGLIGPILVYIFEIHSFAVMGVMIVLIAPFYWILKTPQDHKKVQEQVSKEGLIEELKNVGHQGAYPAMPHSPTKKIINKETQYLISFMFLVYIGLQVSYGSWISSYAVLENVSSKESATKYSSIFWVSITFFRFVSTCLPMSSMKKLFLLGYSLMVFIIISTLLVMFDYKQFGCYFSAITLGMCYSSMFPLLLAIPTEYNLDVTARQNANFMVWAALGQGLLSAMVGYFMAWFSNNMLFHFIALMALMFLACTFILRNFYEKQTGSEMSKPLIELKKITISTSN